MSDAIESLSRELALPDDAPGGMVEYRQALSVSMLFKFLSYVRSITSHTDGDGDGDGVDFAPETHRCVSRGLQHFGRDDTEPSRGDGDKSEVIGKPIRHLAGELHVTGEAEYTDDTPVHPRALFAELVLSTKAHAKLVNVCEMA